MMTDDEIISVVQSHKEGKKIQGRVSKTSLHYTSGIDEQWTDIVHSSWDFINVEYRVAPEPRKPREWWMTECGDGRYFCYDSPEPGVEGQVHVREVID